MSRMPKSRTTNFEKDQVVEVDALSEMNIKFSGSKLRQALKESIGKFKEQFDKSHEEEKFDENLHPNNPQ